MNKIKAKIYKMYPVSKEIFLAPCFESAFPSINDEITEPIGCAPKINPIINSPTPFDYAKRIKKKLLMKNKFFN